MKKILQFLFYPFRLIDNMIVRFFLDAKNPGYELKGECKKCGFCCTHIVVKPAKEFYKVRKLVIFWYWLIYNFQLVKEDNEAQVLVFSCTYLKENQCSIYHKRPYICRDYPGLRTEGKPQVWDECGYKPGSKLRA